MLTIIFIVVTVGTQSRDIVRQEDVVALSRSRGQCTCAESGGSNSLRGRIVALSRSRGHDQRSYAESGDTVFL